MNLPKGPVYNALPQTPDDSIDHQYGREYGREEHLGEHHGGGRYSPSLLEKGKRRYWTGKQYVRELLGREEDEHVAREDADLDRQVQRARHIQKQCAAMNKTLLHYQKLIQTLSSREMALSALLRAQALKEEDGPCADMMSRLGNVMQDDATRRFELDVPLTRLFQEVETYRCRALFDILVDINKMSIDRRRYRGSLLRMADASRQLDPEAGRDLEKFRKAQTMVRESKLGFDRNKDKVCEKVDLLAASFCNLLSNNMAPYQRALGGVWKESADSYTQLLNWARQTLRHQYRLARDIQRDRERAAGHSDGLDLEQQQPTSELWSEGRLLDVVGQSRLLVEKAAEADSEEQTSSAAAEPQATAEGTAQEQETVEDSDRNPLIPGSPELEVQRGLETATSASKNDYSWIDLMTEGSAASVLEEFQTGAQTSVPNGASSLQVQQTLFKLAHEAVADASQESTGSDLNEDVATYEMATPEQMLDGAMRQLTSDEPHLDELVPMNTGLRQRQKHDIEAEARLEQELARMIEGFGSLAAKGSSEPMIEEDAAGDDLWQSMVKASSQPGIPTDLLDMSVDDTSTNLPAPDVAQPGGLRIVQGAPLSSNARPSMGPKPKEKKKQESAMARWYNLFAELDPLANPDDLKLGDEKKPQKLAL